MAKVVKEKKAIEPFFSHDIGTRESGEIKKLIMELGWEGYGLWWAIVEYMHRNELPTKDEYVLAYDFRCDIEKIHKILNAYDLFRIENECYVSDRIRRNIEYKDSKSNQNQEAANARWLLSAFNTCYEKEFGEKPILSSEEIEKLKTYNNQIEDLKSKLPDILYTLKNLKFDTDMTFKPCANWLLAKNNLAKLINGEFGKLKHKKTEKEIKAEERQRQEQEQLVNQPNEFEMAIDSICNKIDAIEFIQDYQRDSKSTMIIPPLKSLMKKFDITNDELEVQ